MSRQGKVGLRIGAGFLSAIFIAGLACASSAIAGPDGRLSHGRFDGVALYRPERDATGFVLFLSGAGGWDPASDSLARALARHGALVAGIDMPQMLASIRATGDECVFPDGDLENLSHYVQAYHRLPRYFTPLVTGVGSGGVLARALARESAPGLFKGPLPSGACPASAIRLPLCGKQAERFAHRIPGPACDVEAAVAHRPELLAAYAAMTPRRARDVVAQPGELADLPIVETDAPGTGDVFTILLSGDGGWAGLDKHMATGLAARGIPVAGLDSLRYFWTPRTPEGLAHDLERMLDYYSQHWRRSRALVIGFSQGADVLPFAYNRLSQPARETIALTALLSVSGSAAFEFHLSHWIGANAHGMPTQGEIRKLDAARTLCLYGDDDEDAICSSVAPGNARVIRLPGNHHFDGNYDRVLDTILAAVPPR